MMTPVQSGPERLMKAYPRVLSFTQLLWTRVTKRNREQREMAPVSTALTNSTVQLPNRKTWTNNLMTKQRGTHNAGYNVQEQNKALHCSKCPAEPQIKKKNVLLILLLFPCTILLCVR